MAGREKNSNLIGYSAPFSQLPANESLCINCVIMVAVKLGMEWKD